MLAFVGVLITLSRQRAQLEEKRKQFGLQEFQRMAAELSKTTDVILAREPSGITELIKNTEQQALLGLHRARQGFVAARTAQANQVRGLLAEFGLVIPAGIRCIERKLPEFLEDAENGLSGASRALFARLLEHFRVLDRQVGSWSEKSTPGTVRIPPVSACKRFRELGPSQRVRWWRVSGMRRSSTMAANSPRG